MPAALAPEAKEKNKKAKAAPALEPGPLELQSSSGASAGLPRFLSGAAGSQSNRNSVQSPLQFKCAKCQEEDEKQQAVPTVQAKCSCCGGGACKHDGGKTSGALGIAFQGVADANAPLPHLDRIQASFGRHNVTGARAQVGGPAAPANEQMGSLAYTAGNRIGFQREPDVKLAAHEAAHVVQQRNGAKLDGGVGRPGDAYEQQADAAAEAVDRGESAEPVLDRAVPGGSGAAGPAVQHQLQVDAAHLIEPPVVSDRSTAQLGGGKASPAGGGKAAAKTSTAANKDPNASGVPETSAGKGQPKTGASAGAPGTTATKPQGSSPRASGAAPAAAPVAGTAPQPAQASSAQGGQGASPQAASAQTPAAPACTGVGAATCYNEDVPEPPESQQQGEQTDPPATKSQEQVSGEVPDVPEPDNCPAQQAAAAAPSGNAASGNTPGAPGPGAKPPAQASAAQSSGSAPAASPAAAPPADAAAAPVSVGSPLGSAVASSEAQRNAAVAAYTSSSSQLKASLEGISVLRGGTKFVQLPNESPADVARRSQAAASADHFFSDTAEQLDRAAAFAADAVPERLGAQAEAAKAQLAASIERQKSAISARVEIARGRARSQAATSARQIEAHAVRVAQSAATLTASAIAALHASHDAAVQQVNQKETETLDRVTQVYAQGRARHEALGTKVGDDCTTRGQEFADEYGKCKIGHRDSIMKGYLTDRRAEAQQNAAKETARGFRKQLIESARKRALDVVKAGRKDRRCAIIAAANASRNTLDSQLGKLVQSLEAARDSAVSGANQARDSQVASVQSALSSTLRQFDKQEQDQRQAADDTGYIQQLTQEQVAHSSAASLQSNVVQAVNSAVSGLLTVQRRLARGESPDPDGLTKALSQAASQVRSMTGSLQNGIETGSNDAQSRLSGLLGDGLAALENVASSNDEMTATASAGFTGSVGQISSGAAAAFNGMEEGFAQQAKQSSSSGSEALGKAVLGMAQACDTVMNGASSELDQSAQDLEKALRTNKQQMECEIPKKANEAAAREAPAWKRVLAVVLIIAVIIIMVVATIVTFGAGGIVAGIIVGAIVGAVTSGMLYAASTLWNNQKWSWGAFGKAVAVGAITGAVGGGLGAGLGGAVKAASVAIRLGVAVAVGAGTDVLAQFLSQGFSFKNFNWTELAVTIGIAIVTFGIGSRFGGRYNLSYGPKGTGAKGFTFSRVGATGAGGVAPHGGSTDTGAPSGTATETGAPGAGTTEPGTPASTGTTEQPGAPGATEQPAAPAATEQPAPAASEQPAPAATEQPAPAATEQPAAPAATEQPVAAAATEQPAPAATEQPAAPAATEQPVAAAATEQPAPAATEQPAVPAATEQPAAPAATEQPVPGDAQPGAARPEPSPAEIAEAAKTAKVKAALEARGLDDPIFDNMDPLVRNKVNQAISSDPMGRTPTAQKAAQEWALEGAGGDPSEFANRYEYAKAKFSKALDVAKANKAPNVRTAAAAEITPDNLSKSLAADVARVQALGPGEHLAGLSPDATPREIGDAVRGLKRVAFQSDTAEAYHAIKHQGELPPEFTPEGRSEVANYEAAYNDTTRNGTVVKAEPTPSGSTLVIIQKTYSGVGAPMEAIIYVKPDGTVVLASYGTAKAK